MSNSLQPSSQEVQRLRRNLEQFRFLMENSQDVIAEVDGSGRILYVSQNVERVLGYTAEELVETNVFDRVHPDDLAHAQERFALPTGSAVCRFQRKDGAWVWLETSGRDVVAPGGEVRGVLVARDITERQHAEETRRKLEVQLRQSQKLEAVGTLAGGIAHDFNNILTVIMAYTELAGLAADQPERVRQYLNEARKACLRSKDLVRQILTFSRKQELDRQPLRLQHIVKETLEMLRSTLPATIDIDAQIDSQAPPVLADPTQIHQVMMNLCTNAAHAMRDGTGKLTVRLQPCKPDDAMLRTMPELRGGLHVRMTVSDTGRGMDEDVLKRIFEPFFTTKAPGEGTGLGLSVVHGIVRNHDGAIAVRSQPGLGTTFEVCFPALESGPL